MSALPLTGFQKGGRHGTSSPRHAAPCRHAASPAEADRGAGLTAAPPDTTLCVWHSYTLNQFGPAGRARFNDLLATFSQTRPLYQVGIEWVWQMASPEMRLFAWTGGQAQETLLAACNAHGHWLEWKAA